MVRISAPFDEIALEADADVDPRPGGLVARWSGLIGTRVRAEAAAVCHDTVVPIVVTAMIALALLPAPRSVAWIALLLVPVVFGWRAGSTPGVVSAVTACMAFMLVHGQPRFASTIDDQLTIRASFLLGLLGAIAAVIANWRRTIVSRSVSGTAD